MVDETVSQESLRRVPPHQPPRPPRCLSSIPRIARFGVCQVPLILLPLVLPSTRILPLSRFPRLTPRPLHPTTLLLLKRSFAVGRGTKSSQEAREEHASTATRTQTFLTWAWSRRRRGHRRSDAHAGGIGRGQRERARVARAVVRKIQRAIVLASSFALTLTAVSGARASGLLSRPISFTISLTVVRRRWWEATRALLSVDDGWWAVNAHRGSWEHDVSRSVTMGVHWSRRERSWWYIGRGGRIDGACGCWD